MDGSLLANIFDGRVRPPSTAVGIKIQEDSRFTQYQYRNMGRRTDRRINRNIELSYQLSTPLFACAGKNKTADSRAIAGDWKTTSPGLPVAQFGQKINSWANHFVSRHARENISIYQSDRFHFVLQHSHYLVFIRPICIYLVGRQTSSTTDELS